MDFINLGEKRGIEPAFPPPPASHPSSEGTISKISSVNSLKRLATEASQPKWNGVALHLTPPEMPMPSVHVEPFVINNGLPNELYEKISESLTGQDYLNFVFALAEKEPRFAYELIIRGINQQNLSINDLKSIPKNRLLNILLNVVLVDLSGLSSTEASEVRDFLSKNNSNVNRLNLPDAYNQPIPPQIPVKLKQLNILLNVVVLDLSDLSSTEASRVLDLLSKNNSKVNRLILPDAYNQAIPPQILVKLQQLTMGRYYNQPFPPALNLENLRTLTMGERYNQPLPGELNLENLRTLTMGRDYNQRLPGELNLGNLETLDMGYYYNQPLPRELNLRNLRTLIMGRWYNQRLPGELNLENLRTLIMGGWYNQRLPGELNLGNLETLYMGDWYSKCLPAELNLGKLRTLRMGYKYNELLPAELNLDNLHTLTVGLMYQQILPSSLNSLRVLQIYESYGLPLPAELNRDDLKIEFQATQVKPFWVV